MFTSIFNRRPLIIISQSCGLVCECVPTILHMSLQQQFLSHDGLVNCKCKVNDDVTATATVKEKQEKQEKESSLCHTYKDWRPLNQFVMKGSTHFDVTYNAQIYINKIIRKAFSTFSILDRWVDRWVVSHTYIELLF